ncbi:MAG: division/cell wall cluster transcriptional repressor MraZ [Chlorobiales bacterium]|jgi:MraZ protein|nr:division/cell wall cluster transcriptional repressor MraZ [Chlorobiales bacterium]
MPGFIGKEIHSIDEKGRLMIPVKFRRKLDADVVELVLMKLPEGCLELYEPKAWEEKEKALNDFSNFNPKDRMLVTFIYESLEQVDLDKQGRIALPKEFLEHAKISKDVVIIGANKKMIIWEPERLRETLNQKAPDYETLTQRMF